MDKKDEIILQQLDVIRTMSENNLKRQLSMMCHQRPLRILQSSSSMKESP